MRGRQDIYINILDDVKLSQQELLSYANELSLIHKVYAKNAEFRHINLGEARGSVENAYAAAKRDKYKGLELPAISEWFYDNRYLFIEQIKQIELNKTPYRLPHIKNGPFAGLPRSFALAAELARHSSFYITVASIREFLEAYQRETELDSGELWVFADMLKAAILCAVSELAKYSVECISMKRRAESFCNYIEKGIDAFSMESKAVLFNPVFIENVSVITRESPHCAEITEKLNAVLETRGLSIERMIKKAHTTQARNIMFLSNAITSLRMLAKINFEAIFENISAVHRHLGEDDGYSRMDFDSREYYRKNVSRIASVLGVSEPAVSRAAIRLSKQSGEHVGAYIIGRRRHELMKAFGKVPLKEKAADFFRRHMLFFYAGGVLASSVVSAALLCISLFFMYPAVYGIIGFVISIVPIYAVAAAVSNKIFMLINKPAFIPKIDLKDGIPESCRTFVAVTSLVTSLEYGQELLEKMQVYYAANLKENLYFVLLSDFRESGDEITAGDIEIINRMGTEVEALNQKYNRKVFFYAQRKRTYDPKSNKFSGKERKRGALLDFCALLRGDDSGFVYVTDGIPDGIKYVITLDADTELSRDAAIKLIGAMEHPLASPVVCENGRAVKSGYAVMQPRIGIDVVSAARTHFSLVFSGKGGLDTYACAASDIYQDGFGTGIYTGKGIFNVDVYLNVLKDAFPDNAVLSHDLLEGGYLRCALVSDVILMDGYPAKYLSWAERQHRWVRGDWQLMPWLFGKVRTRAGKAKNVLSGLTRYQIIDNLRRSLVMPLSFTVILLSQTAFYRSAFFWFISGILPLFIDGILDFAQRIITLLKNAGKGSTLKDAAYETKTLFEQSLYKFAFLPYEAYLMLDAAVRTVVRVAFTRKNLLEWVTAAEGEKKAKDGVQDYWRKMKAAPILASALFALSIVTTGSFSIVAFAVFAVWFFAPTIAYMISRPRKTRRYVLEPAQKEHLEDIALRTWRFFERFGSANEYCWMPDNYQKSPKKGVAQRTSPTNIAFSMTAGIIAYYLGFCTLPEAVDRLEKCVAGIEKAEKWNGHLYNWYDITDLTPLEPRYVSSVDSGNLACYLTVAVEALKDMLASPIAAYFERGIAAVSRETGAAAACGFGEDVFAAAGFLDKPGEGQGKLTDLKTAFCAFINKYAGWARVLSGFHAKDPERYAEATEKLRSRLAGISIEGYVREFHALLGILSEIFEKASETCDGEVLAWVKKMETAFGESYIASRRIIARADKLSRRIEALFNGMDFTSLYDEEKDLFSIGFDVRQGKLSDTHYDLLASEARQTGFIAIAKGDVPGKHWFRLGRPLTVAGESRVLLSWGGTMFEYLMPLIIMKNYDNTLLAETYKNVVAMQSDYGESRRVPWGVSESGYYAFDLNMNYQYKAFGVPGLGMKAGLVREMVVSPYSVFLALHVNARAAAANLLRLEKAGALGKYGFYEAIDYTQSRMQRGRKKRIVKSYMAHHQGMILASILNCLQGGKMQNLFHSAMYVRATEMLLKEKVPPRSITLSFAEKQPETNEFAEEIRSVRTYRHFCQYPEAHFLSNGSYTVMLTQYGTGYSMYRGNIINRWYGDILRRAPGIHVYIKDVRSGAVWSAAYLPACVRADGERAVFEQHKASFIKEIDGIETVLEICVSPECDLEVRSLQINNKSDRERLVEVLCAYTPALCGERDFEAHPAFAELFIETEIDRENGAIYAKRRGKKVCCGMKACGAQNPELLTDRTNIFGRHNVFGAAACMGRQCGERDVQRAAGIKCSLNVAGKSSACVSFMLAAAESRQEAEKCLSGITGEDDVKRVFNLAWTHSQVEMRYLKLRDMQADIFQRIASRTVIGVPCAKENAANADGIRTLWKLGISGDLPIISAFAEKQEDLENMREVAKAQEFMSFRSVSADLIFIYGGGSDYINPLRDRLRELEQAASSRPYNKVYAFARDCLSDKDIATIKAASCLVIRGDRPLSEQLKGEITTRPLEVFERAERETARVPVRLKAFDNGGGGFVAGGTEYCIEITDRAPPPWSNILVNRDFGTLISAAGGGYTWADNAQLKRLTPFRNDPLSDLTGEGIIVRNDRTGGAFSVMPDAYSRGKYRVIHGFGYTVCERYGSLNTRTEYFVDHERPVKTALLELENVSGREEKYSVYCYAEPAMARDCREVSSVFAGDRLEAFSPFDDPEKAMFLSMPGREVRYTSCIFEFFGSPGNNIVPEALKVKELSNSAGPCSLLALQTGIVLKPGEKKTVTVVLGYGKRDGIEGLLREAGGKTAERLNGTKEFWRRLVGRIKVRTSNKSFDTLVNGWLPYQIYASRIWGRTGYYQSGGAYGFRDQLQDSMALLYTDPGVAREFIVRFAGRQFAQGDVLHWWHEPYHGVRTRISDDRLFLPYAACAYEKVTGDMSVFDETAAYLEGPELPEGESDIYEEFRPGKIIESVFGHCVRAIDSALRFGEHGLPLMGGGDWNDAMNRVGESGRGESVWLAFFLCEVLKGFCVICRRRGEGELAEKYENARKTIAENIEKNAWDADWYMRAFFDDGTPIGSRGSPECSIDLVSQAWAVIAGAQRAKDAFKSAEERLVVREEGVIRLLAPPFDKWEKDPGYIKAYLPGIRENGGQYTHAAAWLVIAAAKLREKDKALELFQMLNPINHTRTPAAVSKYKGEPYVMAGDVYYSDEFKGRSGWTWYTGAAGWMYQAALIHLLGMRIENGELSVSPCLPDGFGPYTIEYERGGAKYVISVDISYGYEGEAYLSLDGSEPVKSVRLDKTEGEHLIRAWWKAKKNDIL